MALVNNEIQLAWASLDSEDVSNGWRTIAITASGSCRLLAGRRFPSNEEALLVGFPKIAIPGAEALPDGTGFKVERVDPHEDGSIWLALTRSETGDVSLFLTMVCDIVGMLNDEASSSGVVQLRRFLGRVRAWQDFMRKGAHVLGPAAEIGLVGELAVFSALLGAGISPESCIDAWVGPLDAVQDFELGTGAIEVKSTISTAGFPAKIGSLDQLDDALRQPLFVAAVRLRQIVVGQTLPNIVSAIRNLIRGHEAVDHRFVERLIAAGFLETHADRYSRRFELSAIRIIQVLDDFPRLTMGNVPVGISKAMYEIDLDLSAKSSVELNKALTMLGAI